MGWGRPKFPWEGRSLTGLAGVRAAQGQGQGPRGPGEFTPSSLLLHGGPALSLFSTKKKESRFSQQEVSAESIRAHCLWGEAVFLGLAVLGGTAVPVSLGGSRAGASPEA